jgi:hypothetical protein
VYSTLIFSAAHAAVTFVDDSVELTMNLPPHVELMDLAGGAVPPVQILLALGGVQTTRRAPG